VWGGASMCERKIIFLCLHFRVLYRCTIDVSCKLTTHCATLAVLHPPCSAMLKGVLREKFGFKGHVVSDCGAVGNIFLTQKFAASAEAAAADALVAGTDINCGDGYDALNVSLAKGLVTEADIDAAITHSLTGRFELGVFDPPEGNP
jgi:beta-glucosidase